jgi:hypothetical protein
MSQKIIPNLSMFSMRKLDIAALQAAADGVPSEAM